MSTYCESLALYDIRLLSYTGRYTLNLPYLYYALRNQFWYFELNPTILCSLSVMLYDPRIKCH